MTDENFELPPHERELEREAYLSLGLTPEGEVPTFPQTQGNYTWTELATIADNKVFPVRDMLSIAWYGQPKFKLADMATRTILLASGSGQDIANYVSGAATEHGSDSIKSWLLFITEAGSMEWIAEPELLLWADTYEEGM